MVGSPRQCRKYYRRTVIGVVTYVNAALKNFLRPIAPRHCGIKFRSGGSASKANNAIENALMPAAISSLPGAAELKRTPADRCTHFLQQARWFASDLSLRLY
jgi:hypothetical protein